MFFVIFRFILYVFWVFYVFPASMIPDMDTRPFYYRPTEVVLMCFVLGFPILEIFMCIKFYKQKDVFPFVFSILCLIFYFYILFMILFWSEFNN